LVALVGIVAVTPSMIVLAQSVQCEQVQEEPPPRPHDPARELALKINGSFTLAAVGDVMIRCAASADPDIQNGLKIIRDADIGFGNMGGNPADIPHSLRPLQGNDGNEGGGFGSKELKVMNRATNHIFDSDREGMITTGELLSEAGIAQAGTGRKCGLSDGRTVQRAGGTTSLPRSAPPETPQRILTRLQNFEALWNFDRN
jgi:hypothetical protein